MVRVVALVYAAFCMTFQAHAQLDSVCHPTANEVRTMHANQRSARLLCEPPRAVHVPAPESKQERRSPESVLRGERGIPVPL
jgi:hypothetical protein